MIVVKSNLSGDLRRFTAKEDVTFTELKNILKKLYDDDLESVKFSYKDEEDDELLVTSDEELTEAIRLAKLAEPPILRVVITRVDPTANKIPKSKPAPVIFQGQVLIASENRPQPLYDDPKKTAIVSEPITTTVCSTVVTSEVVNEKPQIVSEQTSTPKLETVPAAVVSSRQQNLARICSNIAEATARMVLAESNPISASTVALATLTAYNSSQLSQSTSQGVSKLCEQSGVVCDSATRRQAEALSDKAKKDCNDLVAITTASSAAHSKDILTTCAPISQHTIKLQNESLKGMNEIMNQDIAEVVRQAMSVKI